MYKRSQIFWLWGQSQAINVLSMTRLPSDKHDTMARSGGGEVKTDQRHLLDAIGVGQYCPRGAREGTLNREPGNQFQTLICCLWAAPSSTVLVPVITVPFVQIVHILLFILINSCPSFSLILISLARNYFDFSYPDSVYYYLSHRTCTFSKKSIYLFL